MTWEGSPDQLGWLVNGLGRGGRRVTLSRRSHSDPLVVLVDMCVRFAQWLGQKAHHRKALILVACCRLVSAGRRNLPCGRWDQLSEVGFRRFGGLKEG